MKVKEALKLQEDAHIRKMALRQRKGQDYAKPDTDTLLNFKLMAALAKVLKEHNTPIDITKPHGVAAWHLLHKFIRLLNLWSEDKVPRNESLADTHDDLEIYSELAKECYIDYQEEQQRQDLKTLIKN
jgi:hypothetical protein